MGLSKHNMGNPFKSTKYSNLTYCRMFVILSLELHTRVLNALCNSSLIPFQVAAVGQFSIVVLPVLSETSCFLGDHDLMVL